MACDIEKEAMEGIKRYCDLLEELKLRVKAVQSIVKKEVPTISFGHPYFVDEFVFVQIRKILEIIAFGSMASNISIYRREYQDYDRHWRAKKILEKMERINKEFYPIPLKISDETSSYTNNVLENVREGYLTQDDFVFLYDVSSKVIHSPNPYSEVQKTDLKMSIDDWMHRIASLLWFHQMRLANSDTSWLVYLIHPETKHSHAVQTISLKRI